MQVEIKNKEDVRTYLIDEYCMDDMEYSQFLNCINDNLIRAISSSHVSIIDFVDAMVKWGNIKVIRCIGI